MARHNKLSYDVFDLVSKVFNLTHVCDDPKLYTGLTVRGSMDKLKVSISQDVG